VILVAAEQESSTTGSIYGNDPMWQARGWKYNGDECLRIFTGHGAFGQATDCFEQLMADEAMWEVWLLRLNVSELNRSDWEYKARRRRNAQGQWDDIPFGAPSESPPGEKEDDDFLL